MMNLQANSANVEIIIIKWEVAAVTDNGWQDFLSKIGKYNNPWDKGLFQVYGNLCAYEQNSLLYIGKAEDSFAVRLLNNSRRRGGFLETTAEPLTIRLGWIVKNNKYQNQTIEEEENWNRYIDVAEDVLVSTHTPALNSQFSYNLYKFGEKYKDGNYLIINWGDRGNLLPEVSTLRNTYRFEDYETPFGWNERRI